jgi:hypothetical protein
MESAAGVAFVPIVVEPTKGKAVGAEYAAAYKAYFEGVLIGIYIQKAGTGLCLGSECQAEEEEYKNAFESIWH